MENEQTEAGRDNRLAKPISQARTETGKCGIFPAHLADREQDWQPYPVDPYSAIGDDHPSIHTWL